MHARPGACLPPCTPPPKPHPHPPTNTPARAALPPPTHTHLRELASQRAALLLGHGEIVREIGARCRLARDLALELTRLDLRLDRGRGRGRGRVRVGLGLG